MSAPPPVGLRLINTCIMLAATIGLLVVWGVYLANYNRLPQIIPTHFGASGLPNHWGNRSMLTMFPILSLAAYVAAMGVHYLVLPIRRPATPLSGSVIFLLMAEIIWLWFFLEWQTIRVALGQAIGLGPVVNVVFILVMLTALSLLVTNFIKPK